ncbi:MAG TPA: MipA/OmpV family protein, partial [Flavobacterium sp.]|nr:MipA/OmpV family protein [Flavobacterium sp.]
MFKKIGLISLLCIPAISSAAEQQKRVPMGKPQGLNIGLGVVGSTGIYIGEKTEVIPVPVISYESDRFFLRGLTAGAQVYAERFFAVNAITSFNMMNLDVGDLSTSELSAKNITKTQLEDRDRSVDLGLEGIVRLPYGIFSMQAVNDVGGASDGAEVR